MLQQKFDDRHPTAGSLLTDTRGGAYSISVLLILPIYIASLAFAVELVLMLNARLSMTAAEEAALHAVKAWYPHRDVLAAAGSSLDAQVHQAVVRSMIPFAPVGRKTNGRNASLDAALQAASLSAGAVDRYGDKYALLEKLVSVRVSPVVDGDAGFEVAITYDAPLFFSFFQPIFASTTSGSQAVRRLESKRFLPTSRNQAQLQSLGIPYAPREAMQW